MSDQFLGEIRLFAGNYPPVQWAFCNGQLLKIQMNTALFAILGNQYGGDGRSTFALPNLADRVPMHFGQGPGLSNRQPGQTGGNVIAQISEAQLPEHTHPPAIGSGSLQSGPANAIFADSSRRKFLYSDLPKPDENMAAELISFAGGGLSHANVQPFIALNYIIALSGVFPQRT